ncbi:MAG: zinc ABC transporter substrate-binding protein [Candidatus Berkiellales bacterium]
MFLQWIKKWPFALFLVALSFSKYALAAPKVVVTLKPIHSLVASVMVGVGEPHLLLPDGASPHTFQLKPSSFKELQQADLVIWIGPSLETFMIKPLTQLHPTFGIMTLQDIPQLQLLPRRQGRAWQDPHESEEHEHHEDHLDLDPHFWLSTQNAKVMVEYIANYLAKVDPTHANVYLKNAKNEKDNINSLEISLKALLTPIQKEPFLVYHDGYQYFEKEFHLNGVGTMIINPHLPLSAHGLSIIRQLIASNHVKCVFRETEFNDTTILNSLKTINVQVAELDPLGARIPKGPDNYQNTLTNLAKTLNGCLSSATTNS